METLEKTNTLDKITAKDIMGTKPKTISPEEYAINAFEMMRKNNITTLIVVKDQKYLGIIHLHDMLKEGFV